MLQVATEMRETERRLVVPSVTVVRDREVSNNELKVFLSINGAVRILQFTYNMFRDLCNIT